MSFTISSDSANELSIISDTLKKEPREDLQKMGIDIARIVHSFRTEISNQPIISETINIKTIPTQISSTRLSIIQDSSELPSVKEGTILLTNATVTIADINEFISTKCVFHPNFTIIMSDLWDAYNTYYNRNISLISFSRKFKEAITKYPIIKEFRGKIGTRSGVWFNGIALKP